MKKLAYPRLWIDIETTGLCPQSDKILEIAYGIQIHENTPITISSQTISYPIYSLNENTCSMHLKNNLINDCLNKGIILDKALDSMMENIKNIRYITGDKPIQIAGASPKFDLSFLKSKENIPKKHLNYFESVLHHRVFDVSTLITFAQEKGYSFKKYNTDHRAKGDIQNTFNTYLELYNRIKL